MFHRNQTHKNTHSHNTLTLALVLGAQKEPALCRLGTFLFCLRSLVGRLTQRRRSAGGQKMTLLTSEQITSAAQCLTTGGVSAYSRKFAGVFCGASRQFRCAGVQRGNELPGAFVPSSYSEFSFSVFVFVFVNVLAEIVFHLGLLWSSVLDLMSILYAHNAQNTIDKCHILHMTNIACLLNLQMGNDG